VIAGVMAANVWVDYRCSELLGWQRNSERVWRSSLLLSYLIFSIALVTEILLAHSAEVMQP